MDKPRSRVVSLLSALAVVLATLVATTPSEAADDIDPRNKLNFKKVDTYFSITWRRGKGSCSNGYKLKSASYRFHRDVPARYVRARVTLAQGYVYSCAGAPQNRKIDNAHNACFGCNGNGRNWSRSYTYAPDWPYVSAPSGDDAFGYQHARLRVTVKKPANSSTLTLGRFCRASMRVGGNPCR
jgi:hypothetical protein